MKQKILYSFIVMLLALPALVKAQNPVTPAISKEWTFLGESPTQYEVSARIVKCRPDGSVQMHVEIFNEGVGSQGCHFKIMLTNPATQEKMVKELNHTLGVGEMIKPSCDNEEKSFLRFNIPAGWNPETIEFTITFIP